MTQSNIVVRTATLEDVDAIHRIETEGFLEHAWSLDSIRSELLLPEAVVLIGTLDGQAAGYISARLVLETAFIGNVAVRPCHRGQGVAKALVQALLGQCRAAAGESVTLEVRPSNTPAITLYGSLGFVEVGRRKSFYQHPTEDALLMTLRL